MLQTMHCSCHSLLNNGLNCHGVLASFCFVYAAMMPIAMLPSVKLCICTLPRQLPFDAMCVAHGKHCCGPKACTLVWLQRESDGLDMFTKNAMLKQQNAHLHQKVEDAAARVRSLSTNAIGKAHVCTVVPAV